MCANFFLQFYLDVSRLNKTKIDIDFLKLIVYNTGTRSVESDGHGHGNSPLAAVGDRGQSEAGTPPKPRANCHHNFN